MGVEMKKIFVLLIITAGLSACDGAGSSLNPAISAAVIGSPSTCTNLTNGAQCTIQITYDTNGISGVALGTSPVQTALPGSITANPGFINSLTTCQNKIAGSVGQSTCAMTITYTSVGGAGTNTNLAFTLGNTVSNAIQITGN